MGTITEELLRKRAEHNEGILSTLEEVNNMLIRYPYINLIWRK